MTTREQIIEELKLRGYKAEPSEVIKNGIRFETILLGDTDVRLTFYTKDYEHMSVSEAVNQILNVANTHGAECNCNVNFLDFFKLEYVKDNLILCLQQQGKEHICKRNFLDLEEYIRLEITINGKVGTVKMQPEHLEYISITEDELFELARANTKDTFVIMDMAQILASDLVEEIALHNNSMLVITREDNCFGASAMTNTEILSEAAQRYNGRDLIIIPSSTEEIIVIPYDPEKSQDIDDTISSVNQTIVDPVDVLSNHAYYFSCLNKKVYANKADYLSSLF